MRHFRSAGFTLIELIVVVGILGVLFGVGAVVIDPTRTATAQAATGFANSVRRVRFEAIRANASAYMVLDTTDSGSYTVYVDADGDTVMDADEVVNTVTFGAGGVEGAELDSVTSTQIGFDRRGMPLFGGTTATFVSPRGSATRIVEVSATGNVEVN